MQKVLRRTKLAKGQAVRRAEQQKKAKAANLYRYSKRQQKPINAEIRGAVRDARKAQREDWTLGALAPKRDVGEQAGKYGTVSVRRVQPPVKKGDGWWKDYCIVEGDRVVIVEPGHRDRGKIGTVKEVKMKSESCVVEGMNEVDVAVPQYMLVNEQDKIPRRTVEAPMPLSSVNLVYPLPKPGTGELCDYIIKKLYRGKVNNEKHPPQRYIADYDIKVSIPYPEVEPEEYKDHDNDTFRIEVEKKTWVPTLIRPPMPPSIIDELRNKYSKFRDRHDEDFVRRKTEEDEAAKQRKRELKELMMSPLKELHRKEREEKKARGKQQLSQDALRIIGEQMVAHKRLSIPEKTKTSNTIATGLTSSTPSHATSSAIRSTLAIPNPSSRSLNSRSIHTGNRASAQAVHRRLTRSMSTATFGTVKPGLLASNALLLKEALLAIPRKSPAPSSTLSIRVMPLKSAVRRVRPHRKLAIRKIVQEDNRALICKFPSYNPLTKNDSAVNAKVKTGTERHQQLPSDETLGRSPTNLTLQSGTVSLRKQEDELRVRKYASGTKDITIKRVENEVTFSMLNHVMKAQFVHQYYKKKHHKKLVERAKTRHAHRKVVRKSKPTPHSVVRFVSATESRKVNVAA